MCFATTACNFSTSELKKMLRCHQFLNIFMFPCVFRHSRMQFYDTRPSKSAPMLSFLKYFHFKNKFHHSGLQFFDIKTSKSGPMPSIFKHFHFKMCVSPQRHPILRDQNFKNVFRHSGVQFFDLRTSKKVLRYFHFLNIFTSKMCFTTAACNFSTSKLQKVLRCRQFSNIFIFICTFRHSRVQFCDTRPSKGSMFKYFHCKIWVSPQRRAIFDFSCKHRPPHPPL